MDDVNIRFLLSAKSGDAETVQSLLLDQRIDVNGEDNEGKTALMLSAVNGHIQCLRYIVRNDKIFINKQDNQGRTALMLSALHGHSECVKCLLKSSSQVDLNIRDQEGMTALLLAAANDHVQCLLSLSDYLMLSMNNDEWEMERKKALVLSSASGSIECVKCLVESKSSDISNSDIDKGMALMLAISNRHFGCVQYLLATEITQMYEYDENTFLIAIIDAMKGIPYVLANVAGRNFDETAMLISKNLLSEGQITDWSPERQIEGDNKYGLLALLMLALNISTQCVHCFNGTMILDFSRHEHNRKTALIMAIMNGHLDCAKSLLKCEDLDSNRFESETDMALMVSAMFCQAECLRWLIGCRRRCRNLDVRGNNQAIERAFVVASIHGCNDCLRIFIEMDINVNTKGLYGNTAFMLSVLYGHIECVRCLLDTGLVETNYQNNDGNTAFMLANKHGHIECVRCLFDTGLIDINSKNKDGCPALMLAVENGHIECVRYLLHIGLIDINSQNSNGWTALMVALFTGHIDCVQCLLDTESVDVNSHNNRGDTAIMLGAIMGHVECIRLLLNTRLVDVNSQNNDGNTAFMQAINHGNDESVKYLFDTGLVDINIRNNDGDTAIMLADKRSHIESLRLLLACQQEDEMDRYSYSACTQAAYRGDIEWVKSLFESDSEDFINKKVKLIQFILLCAMYGHTQCVKYIIVKDSEMMHAKTPENRTPLMQAAMNGHTECVKYLVGKGVTVRGFGSITRKIFPGDERNLQVGSKRHQYLLDKGMISNENEFISGKIAKQATAIFHPVITNLSPHILTIYAADSDCRTALMLAAMNGHTECLRCFLDITVTEEILPNSASNREQDQEQFSLKYVLSTQYPDSSIQYLPGLLWRRPYVYKCEQEAKSVLKLVLFSGQYACIICHFFRENALPHDNEHCPLLADSSEFSSIVDKRVNDEDFQGHTVLMLASLSGHFETAEYLIQYKRIHFHFLLHLFYQYYFLPGIYFNSNFKAKSSHTLFGNKWQRDGLQRLIQNGNSPGLCVNFLLSAYICHTSEDGQSALSQALYGEYHACLRLLVEHVSPYHKMSIQMPNLFLNAARRLCKLNYLPIFLQAGIFHWSWYPLFPYRKQRLLARELVINGYTPGQFYWQGKISSPLHHAFMIKDIGLVRYLVTNLYLIPNDLKHFQKDTDLRDYIHLKGSEEIQQLHQQLFGTPWRLEALSLLTISTLLTNKKRQNDMEKLEMLPSAMQVRLKFMNPIRWLCVRQWELIHTSLLLCRDPIFVNDKEFLNKECCNGKCRRIIQRR